MIQTRPSKIKRIVVDKLFGHQSYDLFHATEDKDLSSFFILYGDNGSGKTTILNLIFVLLLTELVPNAKTSVLSIPFNKFKIEFDDGTTVSALRAGDELLGEYTIVIVRPNEEPAEFHVKKKQDGAAEVDIDKLLSKVKELRVTIHFLPDDRRLKSSSGIDQEPEVSNLVVLTEGGKRVVRRYPEGDESTHHLNLAPILYKVAQWARDSAIKGSTEGDESASSIYRTVIDRIARPNDYFPDAPQSASVLISRIQQIGEQTVDFSRFGLISQIPATQLISTIRRADENVQNTIVTVLRPYIDGVEARLTALAPVRKSMARFIETVNLFLAPKTVDFTLQKGILILDRDGAVLSTNVLSSGERQLLLILANSLLATDRASVFLIDEPEISLNIKWQRLLLDSLKRFAEDNSVQFVLATHSLELIAHHRQSAVRLQDISDAQSTRSV